MERNVDFVIRLRHKIFRVYESFYLWNLDNDTCVCYGACYKYCHIGIDWCLDFRDGSNGDFNDDING